VVSRITPPPDSVPDLPSLMTAYAVRNAALPLARGTAANRVEMIDLPSGPAGRATSVEDLDFQGRGTVRMAIMQTVVALPGTEDLLVISSATPNLGLTDAFFDVFDAVAGSLAFDVDTPFSRKD
jgi:hypothetical protein